MALFEAAVAYVIDNEVGRAKDGGYVNDPDDPGGETKWGISKRAFPNEDIKGLTRERAEHFYRQRYWDGRGYEHLDSQEVATKLLDIAVNAGPTMATRLLQRALNYLVPKPHEVRMDGVLGPQTLALANRQDPELLRLALSAYHVLHYVTLVEGPDTRFETFAKGWLRRALG